MKQLVNKVLIVVLAVLLCTGIGKTNLVKASETFTENNIVYCILDDDSVAVSEYTGNEATVEIPERVKEYKVIVIAHAAFYGNQSIKNVILPDTVKTIEKAAFCNTNLEQINIPKDIESIGFFAFEDTPIYENAGERVKYIGNVCIGIDEECHWKNIEIQNGTKLIADGAFKENDNITTVILPDSLEYIGESSFERCINLTLINIPATAQKNIGIFAFYQDRRLTNIIGDIEYLENNSPGFSETPLHARRLGKKIIKTVLVLFSALAGLIMVIYYIAYFGKMIIVKKEERST